MCLPSTIHPHLPIQRKALCVSGKDVHQQCFSTTAPWTWEPYSTKSCLQDVWVKKRHKGFSIWREKKIWSKVNMLDLKMLAPIWAFKSYPRWPQVAYKHFEMQFMCVSSLFIMRQTSIFLQDYCRERLDESVTYSISGQSSNSRGENLYSRGLRVQIHK